MGSDSPKAYEMEDYDPKVAGSVDQTEIHISETGEADIMRARVLDSVNHRKLNARQIQLSSIAGAIGAALFVAIGSGVTAGPVALLIGESIIGRWLDSSDANDGLTGFIFWATVVYSIAQCRKH